MFKVDVPSNRFEFVELHACRDLTNVSSTDPALRGALAGEIRDACINVGFFYGTSILSMHGYYVIGWAASAVNNHGISEKTIQDALSFSKDFFSLPLSSKMEVY